MKTASADAGLIEKFVSRKTIWHGRAVDFRIDTVKLPNGKLATREYMEHPGAVGVVPFLDKNHVVMVRQYRHPVGEVTLELPAGKLDKGEPILKCLKRELREETLHRPQDHTADPILAHPRFRQ